MIVEGIIYEGRHALQVDDYLLSYDLKVLKHL